MKNIYFLCLISFLFFACDDSNTGNGDGGEGFTHNQLAERFVRELNLDEEFDVTLAKSSTDKWNFIVIYDPYTDSYDAINLQNFDPSVDNASDFYFGTTGQLFIDLDILPSHMGRNGVWISTKYRDRHSGLVFEKTQETAKDLSKMKAIKEVVELNKSAEFLSSSFGLSLSRGKEIARLTAHWKKSSKKGMTNFEQDSFSTELLGFSISEGLKAVKESGEGDSGGLVALVENAASKNNITPEHAAQLMSKIFGL